MKKLVISLGLCFINLSVFAAPYNYKLNCQEVSSCNLREKDYNRACILRCENNEVICYKSGAIQSGITCKFKK